MNSLKPSQLKALEKLATRRVDPHQLISPELARSVCELCHELKSPVGVLLDRGGRVVQVVLGKERRLYLPDIGRARAGTSRLRALRLAVAFPNHPLGTLPRDIITDLQKLQLDAVVGLGVDPAGFPAGVEWAHVLPLSDPSGERYRRQPERSVHALGTDFLEFIKSLEDELNRESVRTHRAQAGAASKDTAVLVGVYTCGRAEAEASMAELKELSRAAGIHVVDVVIQLRKALDPRTVLGKGKVEDVMLGALQWGADMMVFDRELSPSQLQHITELTELKVLDRTMLILDIFSQRARTTDGKLQVELAQLRYSLPRLASRQSGMSRLTGGIGGRGPGETRLEIDKRRARDRITRLEKDIERVGHERALRRQQRQQSGLPVISIIGYTNAGKSTLLNALTRSDVFVANQLFATLDPVSRRLRFPSEREVIITDTVGFIRDLPAELVNAFRATLEELHDADVLLHVVDLADPGAARHIKAVRAVLDSLELTETPIVLALNKADALDPVEAATRARTLGGIPLSAVTRQGVPELLNRCAAALWAENLTPSPRWIERAAPEPAADEDAAPPSSEDLRKAILDVIATVAAHGNTSTPKSGG